MKRFLGLIALISAPSRADPIDDLRSVWEQCLSEHAAKWANVAEPQDILADAVMGQCWPAQGRWQYAFEDKVPSSLIERFRGTEEEIRRNNRDNVLAILVKTKHGLSE